MARICTAVFYCALMLLGPAAAAHAQSSGNTGGLAGLLPELILREIVLPTPTTPGLSHAAHFSPLSGEADAENPAVEIVAGFNQLLTTQLASLPLGSSAGGFTYAFDPALGTFVRSSSSFGPSFAERASTIGKGRLSAGFNYQHARYDSFEGEDLDNGSIKFYLRHRECCTAGGPPVPPFFGVTETPDGSRLSPFFEGDVIEAALSLKVSTDTVALFANYGLTDRWDVAVALPFVSVRMEANVLATVRRLATEANPQIHTFKSGDPTAVTQQFQRTGSASGLGDIVVRTKYRLGSTALGALALGFDGRLPTGDEDELLGGSGQAKFYVIASTGGNRLSPHINLGYTLSAGEQGSDALVGGGARSLPDEFNYVGGVEFAATPRLTLIGDLIGRTLIDTGRLRVESKPFQYLPQGATTPSVASFNEFSAFRGNLNAVLGTIGAKFNPFGDLLVSGSVLFPLNDAGLKSRLITVIGVDYAF